MPDPMSPHPMSPAAEFGSLLDGVPVIPVLSIRRVEDAVPLARALVAGGLRVLEITLRTDAALEAAAAVAAAVPDAVVGVGTVLHPDDLRRARQAGARFALSPGATPDLLADAASGPLPFVPGVATASELMAAVRHGFTLLKFFPAESAGGIATLKSFAGPFPNARFCPTGGIGEGNLSAYLAVPSVVAVGGSWLATEEDLRAGAFERIAERARRAMAVAAQARPATPHT